MRRPAAALLGTLAGTVLLVGAKYGNASPATNAGDTVAASDSGATGGASPGLPGDPSAPPAGSASTGAQNPGAAPGPSGKNPTTGATPEPGNPTPGRTTGGPATTTTAPACITRSGSASTVSSPGVGTVTVTIQVCGGVLKTASAVLSRSNWDKNTAALPKLNSLTVANYKTNIPAIHYSGATLTSKAYQASLRSAMTQAGI